jgi:methyl-accepting chemotaxis protein
MSKLPNLFRFSAWPIATKLIVVMALIAAIPAAAIGIIISIQNTQTTTAEVRARLSSIGSSEDQYIDTWVTERKQDIDTLASMEEITNFAEGPDAAMTAVDQYQKLWSLYESIALVPPNGITKINTEHRDIDVSTRDYFKTVMATGAATVSTPLVSKATGNVIVVFASPIKADGKTIGVIIGNVPVTSIGQILSTTELGTTGEAYMVDSAGVDVTPLKYEKSLLDAGKVKDSTGKALSTAILNFKMDTYATQQLALKRDGQGTYKDYRGVDVFGSFYYIPDLNLGLVIEREQSEVMAPIVQANILAAVATLVAILVAVLVAFLLSRSLTTQIRLINDLFSTIGMGDFTARTEVVAEDELGLMATSLNAMLDNTLTLIQTRAQRDEIQGAIMKLLDEVSGVADGDLTHEAEVTADMTGAIADAFNYMIAQLRQIIKTVQQTTQSVSGSAAEIRSTAEHLSQGSESQARQIGDTSDAVQEMSTSIAQVSENATLSASVSQQALANAQQGAKAVQDTIEGMNRIRDQVQETAKRIKRLGESSQEIGEIVQLIEDIADRTSILALNASIQAAMAGEAGRGFAVVAEEVERLADRSTQATKQISTLIKTTQSETTEAVAAMETTTREVVEGSRLADQAGQALNEIENVSNQLADLIQSISSASKQQSRGSENLARSMMEISEVTQQTAAGTRQAAVAINQLATLADQLRDSVSQFKLPSNGHSLN